MSVAVRINREGDLEGASPSELREGVVCLMREQYDALTALLVTLGRAERISPGLPEEVRDAFDRVKRAFPPAR